MLYISSFAVVVVCTNNHSDNICITTLYNSGKTGAFVLPLLQLLLEQKRYSNSNIYQEQQGGGGQISTLILCPTRELASQTGSVLQRLISYLPSSRSRGTSNNDILSIDVIHGGVPLEPQISRLAKKRNEGTDIDILVATPGRLVDVLKKHKENVDPTISALERRIIDALDEKVMGTTNDYDRKKGRKKKSSTRRKGGRGNSKSGGDKLASSLSLAEIQEMELDRIDDDGRASLDEMMSTLDYLVLDEADRLLGGAFEEDVNELLSLFPQVGRRRRRDGDEEEEADATTTNLKTLLFSATFPEQIEERVDRVLSRISVGTPLRVSTTASMMQRVQPLLSSYSTEEDDSSEGEDEEEMMSNRQRKHVANTTPIQSVLPDTAPKIQHRVIKLNERDRTQALRFLLDQNFNWDRILVFVKTRYLTEHVSRKLRRYGISSADLHGKLDQEARDRRLKSFRSGKTRVLIATDLAARGIDVEGLPVVVNYDLPRSTADFTHRTGRTGRAGKTGTAISFVSAKSESHFDLIEKQELRHHQDEIQREVLDKFPIDEDSWIFDKEASTISVPGAAHSQKGLAHDRMFGGVKGRRKSKKDKLREAAAKKKNAVQ